MTADVLTPAVVTSVLPNGLRVQVARRPTVPLVRVRLHLPRRPTSARESTAAELMAAVLPAGDGAAARALAAAGGRIGAQPAADHLAVDGVAPASHWHALLRRLAELVSAPRVRADDLDAARETLRPGLRAAATDPGIVAATVLDRTRFADDAGLSRPDAALLGEISVAEVVDRHAALLRPRGAVVIVVGDLDPGAATELVGAAFGGWPDSGVCEHLELPAPVETRTPLRVPGLGDGALIRMVTSAPDRGGPGAAAFQLASVVLGGSFSARLVRRLRGDAGVAYTVQVGPDAVAATRTVALDVRTRHADVPTALQLLHDELDAFAAAGPTRRELDAARQYAIGALQRSQAVQVGVLEGLSRLATSGLDASWPDRHAGRIATATAAEVGSRAAALAPGSWTTAVIGGPAADQGDEGR